MIEVANMKIQLDRVPDNEEDFQSWCKQHGFDAFGLDVGRRAWCSKFSTYLRDSIGVATTASGEQFLVYEDDIS